MIKPFRKLCFASCLCALFSESAVSQEAQVEQGRGPSRPATELEISQYCDLSSAGDDRIYGDDYNLLLSTVIGVDDSRELKLDLLFCGGKVVAPVNCDYLISMSNNSAELASLRPDPIWFFSKIATYNRKLVDIYCGTPSIT